MNAKRCGSVETYGSISMRNALICFPPAALTLLSLSDPDEPHAANRTAPPVVVRNARRLMELGGMPLFSRAGGADVRSGGVRLRRRTGGGRGGAGGDPALGAP